MDRSAVVHQLTTSVAPPHRFLTVGQVAERLGVSGRLVHQLIAQGTIPSFKFSKCRRVLDDDLDAYIDRCSARAPSEAS